MCEHCEEAVGVAGEHLDVLLRVERERRCTYPELSEQQLIMRFANCSVDAFISSKDKALAIGDMSLALGTALARLIALQDISGLAP